MFSELLENTFFITLSFLILATVISIYIRSKKRDKCLLDFHKYPINLFLTEDEKPIKGKVHVYSTGIELFYKIPQKKPLYKASYIFYKNEYNKIDTIIRYPDELSTKNLRKRKKSIEITYHPSLPRRLLRNIKNIFNQARDICMEIINLFIGQTKKWTSGKGLLNTQKKSIGSIKNELIQFSDSSFEPILERYIGHHIVFKVSLGNEENEYMGILKEYTSNFIEIIDVDYSTNKNKKVKKADLIIPRNKIIVRHLGEKRTKS